MPSRKKIAANRANALKSTGPKTQAGKEASRRNSLVHGLTAEVLLLDHEDRAAFEALSDTLSAEYEPRNALEVDYVQRLVSLVWRLRRIPVVERSLIAWMTHRMHVEHDGPSGEMPKSAKEGKDVARGGLALANGAQADAILQRLRVGRAIEALLERNLLGKLGEHEARLTKQLQYVLDWLELQKRARVGFQPSRTASGTRIIDPEPEVIPPRIAPPSVQSSNAVPVVTTPTTNASAHAASWLTGGARGGYVTPTERDARKQQEALLKGGSANTAG